MVNAFRARLSSYDWAGPISFTHQHWEFCIHIIRMYTQWMCVMQKPNWDHVAKGFGELGKCHLDTIASNGMRIFLFECLKTEKSNKSLQNSEWIKDLPFHYLSCFLASTYLWYLHASGNINVLHTCSHQSLPSYYKGKNSTYRYKLHEPQGIKYGTLVERRYA